MKNQKHAQLFKEKYKTENYLFLHQQMARKASNQPATHRQTGGQTEKLKDECLSIL